MNTPEVGHVIDNDKYWVALVLSVYQDGCLVASNPREESEAKWEKLSPEVCQLKSPAKMVLKTAAGTILTRFSLGPFCKPLHLQL